MSSCTPPAPRRKAVNVPGWAGAAKRSVTLHRPALGVAVAEARTLPAESFSSTSTELRLDVPLTTRGLATVWPADGEVMTIAPLLAGAAGVVVDDGAPGAAELVVADGAVVEVVDPPGPDPDAAGEDA